MSVTAPAPRALITGVSGQDGSYLAELLLKKGYAVHGLVRRDGAQARLHPQIGDLLHRVTIHAADIEDSAGLAGIIETVKPQECYHLAARSIVGYDVARERATIATNMMGTFNLLSAIHAHAPGCSVCFAGSSEIFGNPEAAPQDENSRRNPRSIYGISKLGGFELMRYYRAHHGTFAATAILYNHESPRRGENFVTRKISVAVAQIQAGLASQLVLGNIEAQRDWGHARDYVDAMWRMLQQDHPSDFVVATGELHSVREFLERAFKRAGLDWSRYVQIDSGLVRKEAIVPLVGDARKARSLLQWQASTAFSDIVDEMVDADCRLVQRDRG
jgi:GDPmannose 4,6-dehydratase